MPNATKPALAAGLLFGILPGCGSDTATTVNLADQNATATPLPAAVDNTLIYLTGNVRSTTPNSFVLDYGPDTITVEMDDWDAFGEALVINRGDRVTVSGRVDVDFATGKTIEAGSVYVHNLGATFYASSADEEEIFPGTALIIHPRNVDVTGRVTRIEGREIILGAATGFLRVDTARLRDNPLDDEGMRKIQVGDRVYVWGSLQFAGAASELMAEGIVSLTPSPRRGRAAAADGNQLEAQGNQTNRQGSQVNSLGNVS